MSKFEKFNKWFNRFFIGWATVYMIWCMVSGTDVSPIWVLLTIIGCLHEELDFQIKEAEQDGK